MLLRNSKTQNHYIGVLWIWNRDQVIGPLGGQAMAIQRSQDWCFRIFLGGYLFRVFVLACCQHNILINCYPNQTPPLPSLNNVTRTHTHYRHIDSLGSCRSQKYSGYWIPLHGVSANEKSGRHVLTTGKCQSTSDSVTPLVWDNTYNPADKKSISEFLIQLMWSECQNSNL